MSYAYSPVAVMVRAGVMVAALVLTPFPARAAPATYVIDRAHTNITFSWDRLGVSRQHGRVGDIEGRLKLDTDAPEDAELEVSAKSASLWTGSPELDRHLRSADFFDAARHPRITFKSTVIKRTGEKTAEVWGELTMLGVAKPVTLEVTMTFAGEHPLSQFNANFTGKVLAGFRATARVQRSAWGLNRGIPLISDDIDIVINAELVRE